MLEVHRQADLLDDPGAAGRHLPDVHDDAADRRQPVPPLGAGGAGGDAAEPRAEVPPQRARGRRSTRTTSRASPRSTSARRSSSADQTVNDIIKEHFPKSIELGLLRLPVRDRRRGAVRGDRRPQAQHRHRLLGDVLLERLPRHPELPRRDAADLLRSRSSLELVPTTGWSTLAAQDPARRSRSASRRWRYFARLVRGTMLETLQQDYVRTARAKGLRYRRVVGLHVLRNSLIPVDHGRRPAARLHHHRLVRDRARSSTSRGSASTTSRPSTPATTRS